MSSFDPPIASNFSEDEELKELKNMDSCANCLKFPEEGKPLLVCSACNCSAYCSKDCQKAHWKDHKPRCVARREIKKAAKEQGHIREFRLLETWKLRVKNGLLGYICLQLFGYDTLKSLGSQAMFVSMLVEFDYNNRTFLPAEKPDLVPIDTLAQVNGQAAQAIQEKYQDIAKKLPPGNAGIILLLTEKGNQQNMGSVMPIAVEATTTGISRASWSEMMQMLGEIRLSSGIFDSWIPLMNQNLKQQLEAVRSHPQFQPFLANALRIETKPKDSRHKTHIVMIFMDMGRGLGEITALQNFQVWPVAKVKSSFAAYQGTLLTQEQIEYYNKNMFDLENSPLLLETRAQRPHNALLPVVFIAKDKAIFVMPNLSEIMPTHERQSVSKCDKKARKAFQQLVQVKFPPIVSPDLH